ncbi:MAG: NVEALA domain-containing protein [Bacteroidales bacterium]|nr:NVEALA domain-containing protein [Bacteroidales bacterium]
MKKKILLTIASSAVIAFAAVVGINADIDRVQSALTLANIEALACIKHNDPECDCEIPDDCPGGFTICQDDGQRAFFKK